MKKEYVIIRTEKDISWTSESLVDKLNAGYSIVTVNPLGKNLEYVLVKDKEINPEACEICAELSKDAYDRLMDAYIRDTVCDGQLFCGCYKEDCMNYGDLLACRGCLKNYLLKGEI